MKAGLEEPRRRQRATCAKEAPPEIAHRLNIGRQAVYSC